jgi:hypothetical protein
VPRPWSTKRIERELAEYVHNKRAWPTSEQFVADGRRRLHDQIVRHAGIACWAYHFGLPIFFRFSSREVWTEDRIRLALELYLRHQRRFPTAARFRAHGLGALYGVISRTGGVRRSSAEFGKPLTDVQRARAMHMAARSLGAPCSRS